MMDVARNVILRVTPSSLIKRVFDGANGTQYSGNEIICQMNLSHKKSRIS